MDFVKRTKIQMGLALDVIRASVFADHIAQLSTREHAWPALHDMCYVDAVNTWNQLFGDTKQASHWSHYQKEFLLPAKLPGYQPFSARLICEFLGTDRPRWDSFVRGMIDARNKRVAHLDHRVENVELFRLDWALFSSIAYRDWMLGVMEKIAQMQGKTSQSISTQEVIDSYRVQIMCALHPGRDWGSLLGGSGQSNSERG